MVFFVVSVLCFLVFQGKFVFSFFWCYGVSSYVFACFCVGVSFCYFLVYVVLTLLF